MIPKDKRLDRKEDCEEPLENQPVEWAEEDRKMEDPQGEDRRPDLGEIEEDTSELPRGTPQNRPVGDTSKPAS
jgi:hypothetical protein